MKKDELRSLIAECITEVISEQEVDEGFMDTVGQFAKGIGKAAGERWNQAKQTGDAIAATRDDYSNFEKKHSAGVDVHNMQKKFEQKFIASLKDAFKTGEKAGMGRQEIVKLYRSAIVSVLNKYKTLEEAAGLKK